MDRIIKEEAQETPELSTDTLFASGQDFFSQLHTRLVTSELLNRQNERKIAEMERKLAMAQQIIESQNHQLQNFNQRFDFIEKRIANIGRISKSPIPCQPIRIQPVRRPVQRAQFVSKYAAPYSQAAQQTRSTASPERQIYNQPVLRVQAKPQAVPKIPNSARVRDVQLVHQRAQQVFLFPAARQHPC